MFVKIPTSSLSNTVSFVLLNLTAIYLIYDLKDKDQPAKYNSNNVMRFLRNHNNI